jgi:hypothetical protein
MPEIGLFDAIYSARALRRLKAEMRELGSICSVPLAELRANWRADSAWASRGNSSFRRRSRRRPGEWIRVAKAPKAAHRGHAFL